MPNLKIVNSQESCELDVKRFYIPGTLVSSDYYWVLPADTALPPGVGVVHNGRDAIPDSPHGKTHHTFYPLHPMPFSEFRRMFLELPWVYAGNKPRRR